MYDGSVSLSTATELSPEQQVMNACERLQMAIGTLAKAAVKADADRRQTSVSAAELDDAHRNVDAAEQELHTTLDRLGLTSTYPKALR